ncbi:DUF4177 domain-containing protein [Paracoccus liaowanqingii]|uniref:DUF4177 domain-containing protein n=1 Tax=Paracoccus liaowanqingii TaxID=2560053 RepID=A0A4Z1C8T7_9RHOB|nr:DUF4177 domain-containing protein [Paracoccus liaowanqingii]TGN58663.1 DUF4177 domain-containing protein [Paracoccus liaowanqingii]
MRFEYSVIPAPTRTEKSREAKTPTDRFALTLTAELNRMAAEGWEYLRADVLPSEERSGLTGRATVYHNVLVFRRPQAADPEVKRLPQPEATPAPVTTATATAPDPA